MKKLILMLIVMTFLMIGCTKERNITFDPQIEVVQGDYRKISAEEAKEMMEKGEYDVILDVRTLDEYNEGHIEGATLLPDKEIKEKAEITLYDKEEVILVYCRSGRRSEAAAKELGDMGYTNVYDFGGIIDWPYEVVKE